MACIPCQAGGKTFPMLPASYQSYSRADGTWALAAYPDCVGGYQGRFEGLTIYVVARGTPQERMFAFGDFTDASEYLNEVRDMVSMPQIEPLPTSGLCAAAVVAVYG